MVSARGTLHPVAGRGKHCMDRRDLSFGWGLALSQSLRPQYVLCFSLAPQFSADLNWRKVLGRIEGYDGC